MKIVTYLSKNLVALDADELPHFVKVDGRQLAALEELRRQSATYLHNRFDHLVVAVSRKQDLARVQLIQRAANGPHVYGVIIWHAQDDLGRSVEPTDEIRGNLCMRCRCIVSINGRAQITNLEYVVTFVDLHRG